MYAILAEGDEIKKFGKGTTHTTIYFPEVKALNIKLPPLEEQKEIVRQIESLFAKEDEAKELLELEEQIEILEKSILAKAFRGELS